MTATEKREGLAEIGLTALVLDPSALTATQRANVATYTQWLHDRYARNVEVRLSVLDRRTIVIGAEDDAGSYAVRIPRAGAPYVWDDAGRITHRLRSPLDFYRTYEPAGSIDDLTGDFLGS